MAYYLKYRPQTIHDLDNEKVRQILTSVLKQKNIPHAFLFTGPKGLGKTSSARIVAKAVNCERVSRVSKVSQVSREQEDLDKKTRGTRATRGTLGEVEPCNECETCLSITNGTHLDILEIDAASNRGIDEIRDLREKIRLAPVNANKKVYIIDEVHMLTTEAFNALLKTLEEPPKHAMFVLATTEPHKVPETIISRCLHVPFSKATDEELKRSFSRIVSGESLDVTDDVLLEIARLADGGFRDGVKILEELVSLSDGKITLETLESRFHTKSVDLSIGKILESLITKNLTLGFETVQQLSNQGADFQYVLGVLIQKIHQILLIKSSVLKDKSLEKQAKLFSYDDLSRLFDILSQASADMKITVIPQLPLELAIVTFTEGKSFQIVDTEKLEERVEEIAKDITVTSLRKEVGDMTRKQLLSNEPSEKPLRELKINNNGNLLSFKTDGEVTPEWLSEFWQAIIHKMKDYNHTVAGVMRGCRIKSYDRESLTIETKFAFHKDKLGHDKTIEQLQTICKQLTGKTVSVSVELVK